MRSPKGVSAALRVVRRAIIHHDYFIPRLDVVQGRRHRPRHEGRPVVRRDDHANVECIHGGKSWAALYRLGISPDSSAVRLAADGTPSK